MSELEPQMQIEKEILEKIYKKNRSKGKDITGRWKNWDFQQDSTISKKWNGVLDINYGHITKLDLSGRGLKKIPKSIQLLEKLEYLNLSNNRLTGKSNFLNFILHLYNRIFNVLCL